LPMRAVAMCQHRPDVVDHDGRRGSLLWCECGPAFSQCPLSRWSAESPAPRISSSSCRSRSVQRRQRLRKLRPAGQAGFCRRRQKGRRGERESDGPLRLGQGPLSHVAATCGRATSAAEAGRRHIPASS
jgi:hypothetical protein